ncbi:MAG: DNA-processing protein DprA [Mariprofundaceae bacterium]|nr:DNA-processing protein DprA [Mariprofundaceae bacterium]
MRLSLVPRVGVMIAQQLIASCGSVADIWQRTSTSLLEIEGVGPKLVQALSQAKSKQAQQRCNMLMDECSQRNIHIICPEDELWPQGLQTCIDAPLILYVQGQVSCLQNRHILAMVGARKASAEGKLITRRWSAFCSQRDICIISGMAPGIDSAAHGGSLDVDCAGIAVLGYGLAAGSPQQHVQIEALAEKGCVISEYAPQTTAKAGFFPQRNRLIAGISQALLVVEGGLKSGSLITARQALNYGREVFAVPGSVLNNIHAGCHQLIQDGAYLTNDVQDILDVLNWQQSSPETSSYQPESDTEVAIITALGRQVLHVDSLAEDCCLTVPALSTILLNLELQGVIEKLPGSRYTLS